GPSSLHTDAGRARDPAADTDHLLARCVRRRSRPAQRVLGPMRGAPMNTLAPLESLYEMERGPDVPLPPELGALYGRLQFPAHPGRPHVIGNFVTTLDGVVALATPGRSGGGEISGSNAHDRMVMGLLRAVADAVVVGAGTLRSVPKHLWTAVHIYPALATAYQALRTALGKPEPPLNVVVTARGELDLDRPVFQSGAVPVLIATMHRKGPASSQARALPRSARCGVRSSASNAPAATCSCAMRLATLS